MKKFLRPFSIIPIILLIVMLLQNAAFAKDATALSNSKKFRSVTIKKQIFGKTNDGKKVDLYTLTNAKGTQVSIMNYNAAIISILTPDKNGKLDEITTGYNDFDSYLKNTPCFGKITGNPGFDKTIWKAKSFRKNGDAGVKLIYNSKNSPNGFDGNLIVITTYTLTNANELKIDHFATADKPVSVNPAWQGYFNLKGRDNGDVLGHVMFISAKEFMPINESPVSTGQLKSVKDTPFDFYTFPVTIGSQINNNDNQLGYANGYNHNWALKKSKNTSLAIACRVYEHDSGRYLEVYTTKPGLQFHSSKSANYFMLSTQQFPHSQNNILKPDREYKSHTVYRFSTRGKKICSPVPPK